MELPFYWKIEVRGSKFCIKNKTEDYRIRKWGGEKAFLEPLIDSLKPDDVFVDIGASIGLVTILAASKVKQVFSFEPDPLVYKRLKENLKLNVNLTNVTVLDLFIGKDIGVVDFFKTGERSASYRSEVGEKLTSVDSTTLDTLHDKWPVEFRPTVIKIDAEGAETDIISGGSKILKDLSPTLWIELHPKLVSSIDDFFRLLYKLDYRIEKLSGRADEIHIVANRG